MLANAWVWQTIESQWACRNFKVRQPLPRAHITYFAMWSWVGDHVRHEVDCWVLGSAVAELSDMLAGLFSELRRPFDSLKLPGNCFASMPETRVCQ